jgi:hypothetical protein
VKAKLYHNNGLATDNVPWSSAVTEAMVGLLAGNKPMAYMYDIEPEDPASDADILQADTIEKYLDRWVNDQDYDITYMDHVSNVVALGRSWKYVWTDDKTLETCAEILWPGHVAAFWQGNNRIVEQVTVERQLTLSEALDLYGTSPEERARIEAAVKPPAALGMSMYGGGGRFGGSADSKNASVTVLTHWYRLGAGKRGYKVKANGDLARDSNGNLITQIGMAAVLMYDQTNQAAGDDDQMGSWMLYRNDDTGYEDIPVHCTARFKVMDKTPDESYGLLMQVAGLHTQYNEVFSAFRDMLWRTIYARYVAKGFTFRNAPKIIPGSAIYALPRTDQDFKRIEESVNTVPIDQFLAHLERLIVVMPGLNNYFLGNAPPSETSGESITAAINASVTRIEPWRTNIQQGEKWTFKQVLAQAEAFHIYTYQGRTVTMASIIAGKRDVVIHWRDVTPKDAEKAKRGAIEGMNAGVLARDTVMDEYNVHSKADERRKIRKERMDPWISPSSVTQYASAIMQLAHAKALQQQLANPQMGAGQQGATKTVLSGKLTPEQEVAAAMAAGFGGQQQQAPGAPQVRAGNAAARNAAGTAAPGRTTADNSAAPSAGGSMARTVAPPARGQTPQARPMMPTR